MVLVLPIASATSEFNYPRIIDHPWNHAPISVFIDNKTVPSHYCPTYYTDVEKAMNYWEQGGNGKLLYNPNFEIVDTEDADIRIRWDENLQNDLGAPPNVAGATTPIIVNKQFVYVNIMLGVGNSQLMRWIPYSNEAMTSMAEHELGHALGLAHSNDPKDIMYPTNEQINNTNPFLIKYGYFLHIAFYASVAITVFLSVSWLISRRKRNKLEAEYFR